MRVLALDSSGLVASVAIVDVCQETGNEEVIAEYTLNYKKTHIPHLLLL